MPTLDPILTHHPFLADLSARQLEEMALCATPVSFPAGTFIFREGEEADLFYALTQGRVAVEIAIPGQPLLTIQTVQGGEVLGWSWFYPPYRWHFDAQAVTLTRAIAFDARKLRELCERDHTLGYALTKRFAYVLFERLQATRLQLLDVYGGR
jgi:CRP-like cAMP-binding protein